MSTTNSLPTGTHFISLSEAAAMTHRYRKNKETILAGNYKNSNLLPVCETFNRAAIDTLLSQPGCEGIRVYYGMSESLEVHAVIVGVNQNNEDLLAVTSLRTESEDDSIILEKGQRCPDECPPLSPLNE